MGRTSDRNKFNDKHSDEYTCHRKKNNDAVQKSRTRSRQKSKQVVDRIKQLTDENKSLEMQIKKLNDDLKFLQNVFQEKKRASGGGGMGVSDSVAAAAAASVGVGAGADMALSPESQSRLQGILSREVNADVPGGVLESDSSEEEDDEDSVPDFDAASRKKARKGR